VVVVKFQQDSFHRVPLLLFLPLLLRLFYCGLQRLQGRRQRCNQLIWLLRVPQTQKYYFIFLLNHDSFNEIKQWFCSFFADGQLSCRHHTHQLSLPGLNKAL
jgi:hypothetical protein